MSEQYVAAIDQGTASSRCLVFDRSARLVSVAQKEHRHIFPRPGWVEHDPEEIWANVEEVVQSALDKAQLKTSDLVALGIANQRESTIVWERDTGRPVHNAINWQDTRTDHLVRELAGDVGQDRFRERSRAAAGDLLLRARSSAGCSITSRIWRACRGRRGAVRDDGLVADLAPDRPSSDRRDERQPDDADEPAHARLGRRPARRARRSARDAARDPALLGDLWRGAERPTARGAGGGGARRPAGRAVRPDLLLAGRGEVHLRHRQLPAVQHRRAPGDVAQRPADHAGLPGRRTSRRPTRWRARSR